METTPSQDSRPPQFILALEYDLSLSTGYSINERESAVALLDLFPDQVRVVCPRPAFPDQFYDSRITYVRDHRRHHPVHYPAFVLGFTRTLREMARCSPPSAMVFRPGPLPLVPAWAMRQGWPVILKKLSGYSLFGREQQAWKRRMVAMFARPIYRDITRRCLAADVESHGTCQWLPTRFPIEGRSLKVIPNGANTQAFQPHDQQGSRLRFGWDRFERIIGYAGAIDDLRCVDAAVQTAIEMRDVPGLGFVLIGDGPLRLPLQKRIREAGLQDRILLPGFLPYQDMPAMVSAFDVALDLSLVPFSVGGSTVFGSFSQKIAQYLACGVPVVAWDTPDTAFLSDRGVGRTVRPNDAGGIAGALGKLLPPAADGPSLRKRAREFACDHLSAESIARTRMEWWQELVAPGSPKTVELRSRRSQGDVG